MTRVRDKLRRRNGTPTTAPGIPGTSAPARGPSGTLAPAPCPPGTLAHSPGPLGMLAPAPGPPGMLAPASGPPVTLAPAPGPPRKLAPAPGPSGISATRTIPGFSGTSALTPGPPETLAHLQALQGRQFTHQDLQARHIPLQAFQTAIGTNEESIAVTTPQISAPRTVINTGEICGVTTLNYSVINKY